MPKLRLGAVLVAVNVGLLLVAIAGMAYSAVGLLAQLGDRQALERVGHAALIAAQAVDQSTGETLIAARLLAERPTLARLLQENDVAGLTAFLSQFRDTAQLSGVAVIVSGTAVAESGPAMPWPGLWTARDMRDGRFLRAQASGAPILLGAWAPLPDRSDAGVIVVRLADGEFTGQLSQAIGLGVTLTDRDTILAGTPDARTALRRQVLNSNSPAGRRIDAAGMYVAARPLVALSGEAVGVVEAELPTTGTTQSIDQLTGTLVLLALGVAMAAALLNLGIARQLTAPLGQLTTAAGRIGRGDLTTPVPQGFRTEVGVMAATLEDMRRHLLQVTADLRRQEAEVQAVVTGVVEGVFSVDRKRRIHYLNPQAAALLGTTAEAALGQFCGDVLRPRGPGGLRPCEEQCPILHARFRGGARATEHLHLPDGKSRTVVITSAPLAQDRQVQVLRDETELEATRRLRDAVLDNISHEFRTPLSAQLASIELLQDQLPELNTEQIGQLIASLQRGTLRLTQLVDNLLESARIEAQRDTLRRRPVALDEVVEEALALTQPLLQTRQQVIEVELPYPLPPVEGDGPRLTQVFVNLLANANKFAPAGTTIRIGGSATAGEVALWVEDEGPGLPEPAGPTLFTRFVRASGEEPDQSGVGLGLWIVKSIVDRHGGRVEARNTGHGTRMIVRLPCGASVTLTGNEGSGQAVQGQESAAEDPASSE